MKKTSSNEYLHSWYLLVLTILSLIFLFINQEIFLNIFLVFVVFCFYFKNGLSVKRFKQLFLYAFFFSFSIFLLSVIYPAKDLRSGEIIQFFNIAFYRTSIDHAATSMVKLFLISFLSMTSVAVIDYTKVVLYLIVHKGLKLFWGYPFLLAMNSIALFKVEFERIRINAKFRNLPKLDQFSVFFPLLVFAIRHSQRGALSLVTRGLNDQKSFYFSYAVSDLDKFRYKIFLLIFLILIGIAVFGGKVIL